jgi:hypothetical protein
MTPVSLTDISVGNFGKTQVKYLLDVDKQQYGFMRQFLGKGGRRINNDLETNYQQTGWRGVPMALQ